MKREIRDRIQHRLTTWRFEPIRIFCFHQVSDTFDDTYMKPIDWLSVETLKRFVGDMQEKGYQFISLQEAKDRIMTDKYRLRKYAVLTADDGWVSLKNILPWLNEQKIPVTLFLNPAYLDGKHYRNSEREKYLTEEDMNHMHTLYPLVTIGMHGWEHKDATQQTKEEFEESVNRSKEYLSKYPNFIPYFAYTWGRSTWHTHCYLTEQGIMPVYVQGWKNYTRAPYLNRELLNEKSIQDGI